MDRTDIVADLRILLRLAAGASETLMTADPALWTAVHVDIQRALQDVGSAEELAA